MECQTTIYYGGATPDNCSSPSEIFDPTPDSTSPTDMQCSAKVSLRCGLNCSSFTDYYTKAFVIAIIFLLATNGTGSRVKRSGHEFGNMSKHG